MYADLSHQGSPHCETITIIPAVGEPFPALFPPTSVVFDVSNVGLDFSATKIGDVNNLAVNIHFLWD